jgi:predicted Zn-ribbon and HTH transcriptional regulator
MVSVDPCGTIASYIVRSLSGKSVPYDVSALVTEVAAAEGRLYRCKLCGRTFKPLAFKYHLESRHCSELKELWIKFKPKALFRRGGPKRVFIPFVFICRSCGWRIRVELPSNRGPPNIKRKLQELLGIVIPSNCPKCGRRFPDEIDRLEFEPGGGVVWDSKC